MTLLTPRSFFENCAERFERAVNTIVRGESDFDRARAVLPFFYYALFFMVFLRLEGLNYVIAEGGAHFLPRWPIGWASSLEYGTVVTVVFLCALFGSLIAAFFPYVRSARIIAFLSFFEYHAYANSFGGVNHQWDLWLWVSFLFIFFPSLSKEPSSEKRRMFSLVFWGATVFVLMTYTMAGIGKISYGFIQLFNGQANAFSLDAPALHVATLLLQMRESVPLGPFIVEHFLLGFVLFLGVLYIQFFSLGIVFRPELYRLWGLFLVLFHVGTFLTMRAVFVAPSALLLLLFLSSPFAPTKVSFRNIVSSLPLFGFLFRKYREVLPRLLQGCW